MRRTDSRARQPQLLLMTAQISHLSDWARRHESVGTRVRHERGASASTIIKDTAKKRACGHGPFLSPSSRAESIAQDGDRAEEEILIGIDFSSLRPTTSDARKVGTPAPCFQCQPLRTINKMQLVKRSRQNDVELAEYFRCQRRQPRLSRQER